MRTMSLDRKSFRDNLLALLPGPAAALTLAAVLACALLAAPQQASANCGVLSPWASVFQDALSHNNKKPQNVSASWNRGGLTYRFNVSWDISDQFPRSVLTGHCIEWTHPATGNRKEVCSTANPRATSTIAVPCFDVDSHQSNHYSGISCPEGLFNIRVRLTVNCNNVGDLPWSDAVSATAGN